MYIIMYTLMYTPIYTLMCMYLTRVQLLCVWHVIAIIIIIIIWLTPHTYKHHHQHHHHHHHHQQVRRLEQQVRDDLNRSLTGRPKRPEDPFVIAQRGGGSGGIDNDYFEQVS